MQRRFWAKHVNWNCGFSLSYMPWRFQSVLLSVFTLIETIYPKNWGKCPRMQNVYFRWTLASLRNASPYAPHLVCPSRNIFDFLPIWISFQQYSQSPLYRHSVITDSLLCPWGKKAFTFSLNSTRLIWKLSIAPLVSVSQYTAKPYGHVKLATEKKKRLFCSPVLQGFDCISFSFWSAEYSDYLQDLRKEDRLYEYNNTKDAMKKILSDFYKNCRLRIEHLKAKHRRELRLLARLKQEATEKGEIAPTSGSLRKISRGVFGFTPRYSSIVQVNGFSYWPFKP